MATPPGAWGREIVPGESDEDFEPEAKSGTDLGSVYGPEEQSKFGKRGLRKRPVLNLRDDSTETLPGDARGALQGPGVTRNDPGRILYRGVLNTSARTWLQENTLSFDPVDYNWFYLSLHDSNQFRNHVHANRQDFPEDNSPIPFKDSQNVLSYRPELQSQTQRNQAFILALKHQTEEAQRLRQQQNFGPGITRNHPSAGLWAGPVNEAAQMWLRNSSTSYDPIDHNRFYLSMEESTILERLGVGQPQYFPQGQTRPGQQHFTEGQRQEQIKKTTESSLKQVADQRLEAEIEAQDQRPSLAGQAGAAMWCEAENSSSTPRRDYAMGYASFEVTPDGRFYLNGQDSNDFYKRITANPATFPFGPAPVVSNPLPGQLGNLAMRYTGLLRAHNINAQALESYGGPGIHGTIEQFQYAMENGLDPLQYARLTNGPSGVPPDQTRFEVTVNEGNSSQVPNLLQPGSQAPDIPQQGPTQITSMYSDTGDANDAAGGGGDEDINQEPFDIFDDRGTVVNSREWAGKGPEAWTLYRQNYPRNEAIKCLRCRKINRPCSYKEKHFPCDRCLKKQRRCIRQFWGYNTRTYRNDPLIEDPHPRWPRAPERRRRGLNFEQATPPTQLASSFVPCGRCASMKRSWPCDVGRPCQACWRDRAFCQNGGQSAPLAMQYLPIQEARCDRCQQQNLDCDLGRPCQPCLGADGSACLDLNRQEQPFQENMPDTGTGSGGYANILEASNEFEMGDDFDFGNDDSFDVGPGFKFNVSGDLMFSGGGGSVDKNNTPTMEEALRTMLGLQSDPLSAQNIADSIAAGARPVVLPSLPGLQTAPRSRPPPPNIYVSPSSVTLPIRPAPVTGTRRPFPYEDEEEDDDDAVARRPAKKPRGTSGRARAVRKGTTATRTVTAAARANRRRQTNTYDPSRGSLQDSRNPQEFDDNPMDIDNSSAPATKRGDSETSSWKIDGVPTRPSRSHGRTGVPNNSQKPCVQNLYDWAEPGAYVEYPICGKVPTKGCEWLTDNGGWTDQSCHDAQDNAVRIPERTIIQASKISVCRSCEATMAQDRGASDQCAQVCQCAWGMTRTWLCNSHRTMARMAFMERVSQRMQEYMSRTDIDPLCPICKNLYPEEGNAWICCSCNSKVYQDPMRT